MVLANINVIDKLRFALFRSVRMRARLFGSIRESLGIIPPSGGCRSRKLGLRVNQEKTADVRFGCVDGFDVDAYRRGLGFVESMHSEINMISVMPTYQQLCLRTTERSDDWN